jgi:hypothetical protein
VQGKSVVQSDDLLQDYNFATVPGYIHRLVWANSSIPDLRQQQKMDEDDQTFVMELRALGVEVTFGTSDSVSP